MLFNFALHNELNTTNYSLDINAMLKQLYKYQKYGFIKIQFARQITTGAFVGRKIESSEQLRMMLSRSTWSTNELLKAEETTQVINKEILNNLLDLSGLLKTIPEKESDKLISSLNEQLNFITKLHSVKLDKNAEGKSYLTRLLDDNNNEEDLIDFNKLMNKIENSKQDLSKGEIDDSWNPISLASEHDDNYFLVKEGLIKKNK